LRRHRRGAGWPGLRGDSSGTRAPVRSTRPRPWRRASGRPGARLSWATFRLTLST